MSFVLLFMRACFVLVAAVACGQSFEAAVVKPNTVPSVNTVTVLPGGERLRVRNMPLLWILSAAYGVPIRQISGLAESTARECYDIEAKAPHASSRQEMMVMLRSLLQDRFKLKAHREMKELKALVLVVVKGGPKIEENRDTADLFMDRIGRSKWAFHNMPMATFVNVLGSWTSDTVVDGTGLTGSYDFSIETLLDLNGPGIREGRETAPDANAPNIYTALIEQLGLKLESRKTPVEVLVIDRIERLASEP
jgi:uncharacterized protein (TIGR03435 family)